jgi:tubulin polyglutamylase TTLL4
VIIVVVKLANANNNCNKLLLLFVKLSGERFLKLIKQQQLSLTHNEGPDDESMADTKFKSLTEPNDWIGTWGKHMKSPCFKTLHSYQKFNHIPGSFQIGRKDRCWRNLQSLMRRHGKKEFGFMPRTFIIPQDLNILRQTWHKYSQKNTKWIIKPPASARGTGIRVVNSWSQIPKRKPLIVQR